MAASENRMRVLFEALRAFAEATSEYERLLDVIAAKLATVVKDGCVVRLLGDDGWLTPVAIHFPIEGHVHDARAIERFRTHVMAPHHVSEQPSARGVLEKGEPLLVPEFDLQKMRPTTAPEIVWAYETIGIHSLLLVPLRARGASIGLLALARFAPGSPAYDEHDLSLAHALADHAALAITNARLVTELKDAVQAREVFLAVASHELRTPLTSVQLGLQMLVHKAARDGEAVPRALDRALRQTLRLSSLIDDLLDVSRIAEEQLSLTLEPVEISSLVGEIVDQHRILAERAGCELTFAAGPPCELPVDRARIEQALENVLANAIKFGADEPIEVSVEVAADEVQVQVADHGIGVAEADHQRIFDPFVRAVSELRYGGLGLGLYIARHIVVAHGGTIRVDSRVGEGARFTIHLPRASR